MGGVFGVMNTMFAAIAQRTRDIGVLRILGFARWQILVSFFLESLLLAIVGGAGRLRARLPGQRLVGDEPAEQRPGRRQERHAEAGGRRPHPGVRARLFAGDGLHRRPVAGPVRHPAEGAGFAAMSRLRPHPRKARFVALPSPHDRPRGRGNRLAGDLQARQQPGLVDRGRTGVAHSPEDSRISSLLGASRSASFQ